MNVIRAAEAHRFEVPGTEFTALAAPSRGSREVCTWRLSVAPHHVADQPHTLDRDEIFMVTAGTIRLAEGGEVLGPGDASVGPAGRPSRAGNPAPVPARGTPPSLAA